ncbi:MAG TPA: NIPSNAP family protein [Pyrinomonadaceae bacterium]|nr:NIPSNAP family protein [Pyrinomonadaceae bacterium]
MKVHLATTTILLSIFMTISVQAQKTDPQTAASINVIEFRNYLLKPGSTERFHTLFNNEFVAPMRELGGYTAGQFQIEGESDHFVWIRAFENMSTRLAFLNAFYLNSPIWKKYRPEANSMIVNNDNVYLLKPLDPGGLALDDIEKKGSILVVDFYVSNGHLDETVGLIRNEYVPFLNSKNLPTPTLFVSELSENKFPQLPAFQDTNLLVAMTAFENEQTYRSKIARIDSPEPAMKNKMLGLITTHSRLVLHSTNTGDK